MKPKHEDKLIEKIFDAYGERWKEKEIEENIRLHLTNVKKCMEHRDLVCTWFMIYAFLNQTETSHCMPYPHDSALCKHQYCGFNGSKSRVPLKMASCS